MHTLENLKELESFKEDLKVSNLGTSNPFPNVGSLGIMTAVGRAISSINKNEQAVIDELQLSIPYDDLTRLMNNSPFEPVLVDKGSIRVRALKDYDNAFPSTLYSDKDGNLFGMFAILDAETNERRYWYVGKEGKSYEFFLSLNKKKYKVENHNRVNVVIKDGHALDLVSKVFARRDKFIPQNYTDAVAHGFDYILDSFQSKKPPGRLAILSGPPGTGKTHFIRSLIHSNKESKYIFLPNMLISQVDGPEFAALLFKRHSNDLKSIVLILEDADIALAKRDRVNTSDVSALLNYTDGIYGDLLDIKVLATTNLPKLKLDPALLRKGRLLKYFETDKVSPQKANEIYQRITNKYNSPFSDYTLLADIYAYADDVESTGHSEPKEIKIGFK